MFNNVALDVFIGLAFIYLLYSLLATIVIELLARMFSLRARMLQTAVRRMLEDDPKTSNGKLMRLTFFSFFYELLQSLTRYFSPFTKDEQFVRKFYDLPSIKYLAKNSANSKPSYLDPANFSQAIVQLLRTNSYDGSTVNESTLIKNSLSANFLSISPQTLKQLRSLWADSKQDVYKFKTNLEQWFQQTMERANGWYKKQIQVLLLVFGLLIAYQYNIDSIAIAKILTKDKTAREQLVQLATSKKDQYAGIVDSVRTNTITITKNRVDTSVKIMQIASSSLSDTMIRNMNARLNNDGLEASKILGLGHVDVVIFDKYHSILRVLKFWLYPWFLWRHLGWVITALAISLGAPFWFDLLNKFVQLRQVGTRPADPQPNNKDSDKNPPPDTVG